MLKTLNNCDFFSYATKHSSSFNWLVIAKINTKTTLKTLLSVSPTIKHYHTLLFFCKYIPAGKSAGNYEIVDTAFERMFLNHSF